MLTVEQRANVEKWLDTLENGMHKQGNNFLKALPLPHEQTHQPKYCCLGVAAEAVLGRQFLAPDIDEAFTLTYTDDRGEENRYKLSWHDKTKLGLDKNVTREEIGTLMNIIDGPAFELGGLTREGVCITMNDSKGFSFKQIAQTFREMGWDK